MERAGRDAVITGMGSVTALGVGVDALWRGVREGRSAVDWLQGDGEFDPADGLIRYAAQVKDFSVDEHLQRHCEVRRERSVQMGLVAAREALSQAQLIDGSDTLNDAALRIGTVVGSGHGACQEAEVGYAAFFRRGPGAVRPTTVPKSMFNSLSANLSIYFGTTGTNLVIASACASGASAIGLAAILIRQGVADIVLAGGADAPLTPALLASWTNLRVLARHSEPSRACRPFDRARNGMVLGEAAAMVVVESRASALRRGVTPLCHLRGYGASSDAFHVTAPTVAGQRHAMEACLSDAHLEPVDVQYVNAHGTGTKTNDETEAQAIVEVFGRRGADLPISSTKSMLGHSLGASGAVEFVVCAEALRQGFIPPTINCEDPDPAIGLDYVPMVGREIPIGTALSNSFAFGGNNISLLLQKESLS